MSRAVVLCLALCAFVAMASAQTLYFSSKSTFRYELQPGCNVCPVTAPCYLQDTYSYALPQACDLVFMDGANSSNFRYFGTETINIGGYPGTIFQTPKRNTAIQAYFFFNFPNANVRIHDMTINLTLGAFTVLSAQSVLVERVNLFGTTAYDTSTRLVLNALNNVTIRDSTASIQDHPEVGNFETSVVRVIANQSASGAQEGGAPFPIYLHNISCTTPGQSMWFVFAGSPEQQPGTNKRALGDSTRYASYVYDSATKGCGPTAGQLYSLYWQNVDLAGAWGTISRSEGVNNRATNFTFVNVTRALNPAGPLRLSYGTWIPSNVTINMVESNIKDFQFSTSLTDGQWNLINSPSEFKYVRYYPSITQLRVTPYPMYIESSTKHNTIVGGSYFSHNTSGATLYLGAGSYDLTGSTFSNNLTALDPTGYSPQELAAVQLAGGTYYFGDTISTAETSVPSFLVIGANDTTINHDGPIALTGDILGGVTSGSGTSGASGALSFTGPSVIFESISIGNYAISLSSNTNAVYRVTNPAAGITLDDVRTLTATSIAVSWDNSVVGAAPVLGTRYLLASPVAAQITATDATGQYLVTSTFESGASYFTFTTSNPAAPPIAPVTPTTPPTSTPSSTPTNPSAPSSPGTPSTPGASNPTVVVPGTPSATPDQYHEPTDSAVLTSAALALPAFAIALVAALL